jgi:O-antigen ligase
VAIVHNIYSLTAAEMGYAGVVALVILFLVPLASALWYGLRARHDRRGDVLLGLGVGLIVFYTHGFFEWVWRLTEVSYVYFTIIGIIAVLTRQIEDDMAGRSRAYRMVGERQAGRLGQPVRGTARPEGAGSAVADRKSSWSLRASRRTS